MKVIPEIDEVLHQSVRIRIIALLANVGKCTYTTIRDTLELTDGHMTTHMRKLISEGYVLQEKKFVENKPNTTYSLSPKGRERFKKYIKVLSSLAE